MEAPLSFPDLVKLMSMCLSKQEKTCHCGSCERFQKIQEQDGIGLQDLLFHGGRYRQSEESMSGSTLGDLL